MFIYGDIISISKSDENLYLERLCNGKEVITVIQHKVAKNFISDYFHFLRKYQIPDMLVEKKDWCFKQSTSFDSAVLKELSELITKASFTDEFYAFGCPLSSFKDRVGYSNYKKLDNDFIVAQLIGCGSWDNYISVSNYTEHVVIGKGTVKDIQWVGEQEILFNGKKYYIKRLGEHFYINTNK